MFSAVVLILRLIGEFNHSVDRAAFTRGYLFQLQRLQFVPQLLLVISDRKLRATHNLSKSMQHPELDLAAADVSLIRCVTAEFQEMRHISEQSNDIVHEISEL
jgi:hypothetical protein